ncbi:TetR/AcrR family transcriptional regulator [Streptacidiphilus sp. ASG 303]|uniref:TetR/AcrR family transcriptional regulator n=1 Tax=Streptacidiphilus sp. ASG 303 TaxID=2896847 RepID=UPI001E469F6E|nr:TetR family transcriptional regulator [Streptacidiphilus sp. ASG 303]MCD0480841.1 TetR/AcrR family transcriptional regulator [Streptacidiphilus sp. ASG 303]
MRLADEAPAEASPCRADAVRNRLRLLEAAARLVAEHGPEHVTMEAVAAAAGVGKGTVFRRFGDRAGLMLALLDHAERAYQQSFLAGPPPLGPGAPPVQRLEAFGTATLRHLVVHAGLLLAAEHDPDRRFAAPRRVRLVHVSALLREAGAGGDQELLAEALLAFLDTALVDHLRRRGGMTFERLDAGWRDLVARVVRAA